MEEMLSHKIWNVFIASRPFFSYLHQILCPRILVYRNLIKRPLFSSVSRLFLVIDILGEDLWGWEEGQTKTGEGGGRQRQKGGQISVVSLDKLKTFFVTSLFRALSFM